MPRSALRNVKVDHCLPLAKIGPLLVSISHNAGHPEEQESASAKKRSCIPNDMEKEFGLPTRLCVLNATARYGKPNRPRPPIPGHEGHAFRPTAFWRLKSMAGTDALVPRPGHRERANLLRKLGERKISLETVGKNGVQSQKNSKRNQN